MTQPRPVWKEPTAKERLTGLVLIIIVAVIWIAASFVVQELRLHPFLITYICNILFIVYIPISTIQDVKRCSPMPDMQHGHIHSLDISTVCRDWRMELFSPITSIFLDFCFLCVQKDAYNAVFQSKLLCRPTRAPVRSSGDAVDPERQPVLEQSSDASNTVGGSAQDVQPLCVESSPELPLTGRSGRTGNQKTGYSLSSGRFFSDHTWKIVRAASCVAPFWFLAQLCFNTSLHLTSVTSNTILSSPSSLFTYLLSVIILHEQFSYGKLSGVGLTIVGMLPVPAI